MPSYLSFKEISDIVNNIMLSEGDIAIEERNSDFITFHLRIAVSERGVKANPRKIYVQISRVEPIFRFTCFEQVLLYVQQIWTSMYMHESLETFAYVTSGKLTLPFDPHCNNSSMRPSQGSFLTDGECQVKDYILDRNIWERVAKT